jgi:hypothetical protein
MYPRPQRLKIVPKHRPHFQNERPRPAELHVLRWHDINYKLDLMAYWAEGDMTAVVYARELAMPTWAVLGLAALFALPAFTVGARLTAARSRRQSPGYCPSCDYDLTGNTSGVCPECGTPVPKEPADKSPRTA